MRRGRSVRGGGAKRVCNRLGSHRCRGFYSRQARSRRWCGWWGRRRRRGDGGGIAIVYTFVFALKTPPVDRLDMKIVSHPAVRLGNHSLIIPRNLYRSRTRRSECFLRKPPGKGDLFQQKYSSCSGGAISFTCNVYATPCRNV